LTLDNFNDYSLSNFQERLIVCGQTRVSLFGNGTSPFNISIKCYYLLDQNPVVTISTVQAKSFSDYSYSINVMSSPQLTKTGFGYQSLQSDTIIIARSIDYNTKTAINVTFSNQ
jgi:hypothetical protein